MLKTQADWLSNKLSRTLLQQIAEYWERRGHRNVRVIREEVPGFPGNWQIRSNLVGGLPT